MIFRGLKQNIVITIAGLLTVGMALITMVIVTFWQRDLIRAEVNRTQALLRLWSNLSPNLFWKDQSASHANLQRICSSLGGGCRDAMIYNGIGIVAINGGETTKVFIQMRTVALSGVEIVRFSGSLWRVYSLSRSLVFICVPITHSQGSASLGVVIDLHFIGDQIWWQQRTIYVYILLNILILSTVGFFRMMKLVVRPVEKLVAISDTYKEHDETVFVKEKEDNEFGKLSLALNRMVSRIETDRKQLRVSVTSLKLLNEQLTTSQKEMVRTEKLAVTGRLSAGLAHEIGNPLSIIQGYLELLENNDLAVKDRQQFCQRSIMELNRINRLVRQLLNLTRAPSAGKSSASVYAVLNEIVEILQAQKNMASIEIRQLCRDSGYLVSMNNEDLRQVVLNCLLNATDAIIERDPPFHGLIVLSCQMNMQDEKPFSIMIRIEDNGMGIAENDLENVFEPFFTTKEPGKGTGLGLSVSRAIIEAARGRMWVKSEQGEGTTITIELPVIDEESL